ncbi:MAG: hypothetical protein DWQ10_10405 [Calditrichaeota bacterium]|nr:MAG: hypothetical protein DWQ10_10405 [Calditrichota bacterium]
MYSRIMKFFLVFLVLFIATASAQTFSGRVTSSFYAYERADSIDNTSTHARGYQGFQFDYRTKNILLRTFGQVNSDFNTTLDGDGVLRMYSLYLQWRNFANRVDLKLGRQPVFGGISSGTFDGASVQLKAAKWLRFKAFGGGLLPATQEMKLIDDLDKNFLMGGQISYIPNNDLIINASYNLKRQNRLGYNTRRSDEYGNVYTAFIEPREQEYQLVSLDGYWSAKKNLTVFTRHDFDLNHDQLTRSEFNVNAAVNEKISLTGTYLFRSPLLPANSIFSVFNIATNSEVEGGINYRMNQKLSFYVNSAAIMYDADNSLRTTLGVTRGNNSVQYFLRRGYAGIMDGFNLSSWYPMLGGKLLPNLMISWAKYKIDEDVEDSINLFSGSLGVTYKPVRSISVSSQVFLLSNKFYEKDYRFIMRLQYWFFMRGNK